MKIAVIGATGYVGKAVVHELAARGHNVRALARNPANVLSADNVEAIAADVASADFAAQLQNVDAVISAFNPGWSNPNIGSDFTRGYQAILAAAKTAQVPYLLIVGGAGSLYVNGQQLVDSPDFPAAIKPGASAARDMFTELQGESSLDWTLLSPPVGFHGGSAAQAQGRTGQYRSGQNEPLMQADGKPGDISVQDLAVALVDALEKKAHLKARFTVAY